MKEVCSCGAVFKYYRGTAVPDERLERVWEMLKEWRENHRHEFAPAMEPEHPLVVESGSSHERAMPLGFAPEPEGGWA